MLDGTLISDDDDDLELYEQCFELLIVCYGNVNTVAFMLFM